jgi:hypothetical protein
MHLFIDTNVLLSFYHFTGDDLEELKKLTVLLEQEKLHLYVPAQIGSEFRRNRESKIADALKKLKDQHLNLQFPQICKDYPEYGKLRELQRSYESHHTELLNKLSDDVTHFALKADGIIFQLFKLAENVACNDAMVRRARDRCDLGNPPGKDGSLGDAVIWEALLGAVPQRADLHFITDDKDYCSALNEDAFSGFLSNEWQQKKKSKLVFYKRISVFFKEYFPDIKLAAELEKDLLIEDFANSSSFAQTHEVVAKLSKYADFTPAQLNAIVSAALSNSQITLIAGDADVHEFLEAAIKDRVNFIETKSLVPLAQLLRPLKKQEVADSDIPF